MQALRILTPYFQQILTHIHTRSQLSDHKELLYITITVRCVSIRNYSSSPVLLTSKTWLTKPRTATCWCCGLSSCMFVYSNKVTTK
ncbi:hypothetical protein HanXRQr2_Chr03g0127691 [Helianthus annuus]|uniref:Uncharacterized protein n=1 Tax=Helianthus annuus TaxID=4232 RepID=A0A9K3JI28_HELAN|nr:hypothetical protein HanXRQr2_Chr03g0127691 [Helianthus annuus]KAJ0945122.1 hypothetical protein HanPSC8_Chr03g0124531 [Helianthus annuus]